MFRQKKGELRRETYPVAPLGENSLGVTVVCFSEESIADI